MPRPPLPADFSLASPDPRAGLAPSRCLFAVDAGGAQLVDALGTPGTFARTSEGTTVDSTGAIRRVAPGQPRWYAVDLDGDGAREALGLLLERASVNLCPDSSALSAWTALNCPATDAWLTIGDVALARLGNAAAGFAYRNRQCAAFSGDGTKAFSVVVAPSPAPDPAGVLIGLYDAPVDAWRCRASYVFDAAGVPQVTLLNGSYLGREPLVGGAWRLYFQAPGAVAAHAHFVFCYPTTEANGDAVLGGVQVEDLPYPTSVIPTAGASVARATETLSFPLAWGPQDCTLAVELARPVWAGAFTGLAHVPLVVGDLAGAFILLSDVNGSGVCGAFRQDAAGVVSAQAPTPTAIRGLLRERVSWAAQAAGWRDRRTPPGLAVRSDAGAGAVTQPVGAQPPSSWPVGGRVYLDGGGSNQADAVLLTARVAPGLRTLDEMRGLR